MRKSVKVGWILFFLFFQSYYIGAQTENKRFTILANKPTTEISPTMWGIFFEDINFGADGGLYAELIKNRSFEFPNNPLTGWTVHSKKQIYGFHYGSDFLVINDPKRSINNPHFLQVTLHETSISDSLGITNEGFRGMGIKNRLRYDFSIMYRQKSPGVKIHIELVAERGRSISSAILIPDKADYKWHKMEVSFTATATYPNAKLNVWFEGNGILDIDMLSLFPSDTWKSRKGGLRADMVQMLADMKPGFIRFPGGCIVEGRDLSTRYQWKKTIGPVDERPLVINRWNNEVANRPTPDYYQTFGLGFFEYFQLAEDIGAEPLPILNCGMACQFNSKEIVPMEDMDPYVQDALDLIEFANGSVNTKWGKIRADLGHPAPFHLKIIGIGNENWGPQYIQRLEIFQQAIHKKYPDIKLVGSSGLILLPEPYNLANKELRNMQISFIDEHYYSSPQWFLDNAKRYDNYDRHSKTKVFVGEYAAQSVGMSNPGNRNTWLTALSEAAYMTGLERNADIVKMASYAPLFSHVNAWQWTPDLIWVDNLHTMPTPNYYVQKLYSTNKGNEVVPLLDNNHTPITGQDSLYASSTIDKTSHELIIKIANVKKKTQSIIFAVKGIHGFNNLAQVTTLQSDNLNDENSFKRQKIVPIESTLRAKGNSIPVQLKPYSFSVIRIKLKQ